MEVKMAAKITIQTLLDAGCHYGHQTRRWNPKMKPYIFGERNGIYILDLKQTMLGADAAYTFLKNVASKGGRVLFVGTKKLRSQSLLRQLVQTCLTSTSVGLAVCSLTLSPCVPASSALRSLRQW